MTTCLQLINNKQWTEATTLLKSLEGSISTTHGYIVTKGAQDEDLLALISAIHKNAFHNQSVESTPKEKRTEILECWHELYRITQEAKNSYDSMPKEQQLGIDQIVKTQCKSVVFHCQTKLIELGFMSWSLD